MILLKSERNKDVEGNTDLGSQYCFPIKETRLLGEMTEYRAHRRNIEEEPGGSFSIKNEVLKKKKKKKVPHYRGYVQEDRDGLPMAKTAI